MDLFAIVAISAVASLGYIAPERVRNLFATPVVAADAPSSAPVPKLKPRPDVESLDRRVPDAVLVNESDSVFYAHWGQKPCGT